MDLKDYTDYEIVECLRNRQSYVVHYLFEKYLPMIRLMVYRKGGSSEDARDIFQEAMIIMLEKMDNKDFALTCKFKTYLYCVCENLWSTVLEKKQIEKNYLMRRLEPDEDKDFTERGDQKIYEEILWDAFEKLEPQSQQILKMYWHEKPLQEIADKLGYAYGYVKKLKCEAQSELMEKVKNHPGFIKIKDSEKIVY